MKNKYDSDCKKQIIIILFIIILFFFLLLLPCRMLKPEIFYKYFER